MDDCVLFIGLLGPLLPLNMPYHTLKLNKTLLFNKFMLERQALPAKSKTAVRTFRLARELRFMQIVLPTSKRRQKPV